MKSSCREIEPIFHFVWFGAAFVDFGLLAIASALAKNPGAKAILWHGPELKVEPKLRVLTQRGLELREINAQKLIAQAKDQGAAFDEQQLTRLYQTLSTPAARSNLIRLLAVYVYGGIYLDTDTLTLKSFDSLRVAGGFCGLEHILWPTGRAKLDPRAIFLGEVRRICANFSVAYPLHKRMLRYYYEAANNAVLGFRSEHWFVDQLLLLASQVPEADWRRRFRLGTHLLQQGLSSLNQLQPTPAEHVLMLPPRFFYPVGPVVSEHYFRKTADLGKLLSELLNDDTVVIHWYASVSALNSRDFNHIRARKDVEVYSHLCSQYLTAFES